MNAVAIRTFKDLIVWQKAFRLAVQVHQLTTRFPADEKYGLSVELRRTARSVAYNVAEGHKRGTTPEYRRFLRIAAGSAAELETQLLLARAVGYFSEEQATSVLAPLGDVERMLAAFLRKLRSKQTLPLRSHRARPSPDPRSLDP